MRLPGLIVLLVTSSLLAGAQQRPRAYQGTWTATAGAQTFHGRWTGKSLPGRPNAARGTWELTSDSGSTVLRGTWSAERHAEAWQGTFAARRGGRVFSGRWSAYLEGQNVKTFQEMLQRSMEKEVAGAWDSGAMFGKWWLGK